MRNIDGKKVCWNFRKGRCRFGHKCTFAHDSDVKLKAPVYDSGLAAQAKPLESPKDVAVPPPSPMDVSDDAVVQSANKKKRPGLSQGIEPSKKAMKFHNKVYN